MQEQEEKKKKDGVRPKAMASATPPPHNQRPNNPKDKVREEGELTSSDDDDVHVDVDALPVHSNAPSTSVSARPSSTVPNILTKTYMQDRNPGKPMSASLPARAADKLPQGPRFDRNKVLLKSGNPGWHAPAGNSSLVISFSDDDDSGSDEERRQKTVQASYQHLQVAKNSKKPPALPHVKPAITRRAGLNEGKVATKKLALNRTFVSTMTKIHGSSVKATGPLAERRSWSKNSNVTGRILPNKDGGSSKHMDISSSKLQDLRQQIAMRENELKLKIVQKSKENVSEPGRDIDDMGQGKVSSRKGRTMSAVVQADTEEPDAKRLKLAQNSFDQPSSRGLQGRSFVLAPLNDNVSGHVHHVTKVGQKELLPRSSEMHIQDGRQLPPPSHNKQSRLLQDASGVAVSCSLSDWVSRPAQGLGIRKQTASLTNATFADHLDKSHRGLVNKNKPSNSVKNLDLCVNNMNDVNDHHAAVSAHEKLRSNSDSTLQPRSQQVSDHKDESPNASPDSTSVLHSLDRHAVSGCDVDSLFDIEEAHDKELEEAQERRRRCEIEERNALKVYRRAQRALAEANARCNHLYRKRELYSAQLRSFLMEDSRLLLTSRQHRQNSDAWNVSYNVYEANLDLIPTSSHQLQAGCEPDNQVGYGSNAQSADGDAHYRLSGNEDANNLGSEACSEPDASTSDFLVHRNNSAGNGFLSPSNDPNLSPDDGETFSLDHRPDRDTGTWMREEDDTQNGLKDMNADSARCSAAGSSQDPLFLEAYLRSKLFSRLGVVDSSKTIGADSGSKSAAARVADENIAGGKAQTVDDNVPLSDPRNIIAYCEGDFRKCDGRVSQPALNKENPQPLEEHSLNNSRTLTLGFDDTISHPGKIGATSLVSSSSIFRSAMIAACSSKFNDMQIIEPHECSSGMHTDDDLFAGQSEDKSTFETAKSPEEVVKPVSFGRIDSYTFEGAIDPFRPLCIYELRGRCNNDECPWQHLRENSSRKINGLDHSVEADCKPGSSPDCQKQRGCVEAFGILTPPKYVVCFDGLKAQCQTHDSLARYIGPSRKNIFSNSLVVSNSIVKQLPSDEPYLHGNDGCVDSFVGVGHSLYFQSRNGAGNPLRNGLGGNDQVLEIALLVLNQEVDRSDGMTKALSVLSRALEADPASFQLWIVYLLLFHSTRNSDSELTKKTLSVEDDLFSHAVKHNTESYELWLLYINSRSQLNDRFAAYERALSCLCHHASAKNGQAVRQSAVILDLFLQMLYSFCISGNSVKAVQRIQALILANRDSDESHSLLLSDILQCLKISDKCIFWVSCVYLVIYRKLPDALVQQFEFEKDISVIEWPHVRLTLEEKRQVLELMELALDSFGLHPDSESSESSHHNSTYLIALNHIKLMAAIDGEESCKRLLVKYRNSYPSCLQLILLTARAHGNHDENKKFEGFEEALCYWLKDEPGFQCIWNQFAEYALENDRPDKAKEIMDQWFHSVWKPFSHNESIDSENDDNRTSSVDTLSGSNLNALPSSFSKMDTVFALLNLSLFRVFQNDVLAAHVAIDKALNTADAKVLRQCVREHAAFLFYHRSLLKKDTSLRGLMDILKGYAVHAQSVSLSGCLTTKFIQDFKKPRLRQLIGNILCPSSPDSSLVNSVLDIWFGPSLLRLITDELKDLVDFVESILEVSPGNYQVAMSACRLICKNQDDSKTKSPSVLFWASSLLVNTIYHAIPVPPEFVWVEAADLLGSLTDKQEIYESFHQRAVSAYPFSINLWKSFLSISSPSKRSTVIEAARNKGIEIA